MFPDAEEQRPERRTDPPELGDAELDDISGGVLGTLPEFRGRGVQPDGGGGAAHC
jgi:hypothetical protein